MEGAADKRWSTALLGDRYPAMIDQIIAFRAHTRDIRPSFKLGQDEQRPIFGEIIEKLGNRELANWMKKQADR
jgi:transcriptional regulator